MKIESTEYAILHILIRLL